jgi:chromosome partitioning protein
MESMRTYRLKQILEIFGSTAERDGILRAEKDGSLPKASRQAGSIPTRVWSAEQLPLFGERYGFLSKVRRPVVLTVFTSKGGVLKTTIALNIARMAALHNIRTLVIGLDLQCDITSALGFYRWDEVEDLQGVIRELERTRGLYSMVHDSVSARDLVQKTEIPTLDLIPETAELATLDRWVSTQPKREYWLREKVIGTLRDRYDLIVLDCSPNWSQLISNAIVACDVLVSPIECHINQFRNLNVFRELAREFKQAMNLEYQHVFVPTRYVSSRKLSGEIRSWYLANVEDVTFAVVRESVQGEEAMAMRLSIPEYAPTSPGAAEIRALVGEIWSRMGKSADLREQGRHDGP